MKLSKSDLELMRWNIVALCAAALIGGLIVYASEQHATTAQRDRRNAQSQLADARNRLNMAREDETNMHYYFAEHLALERQKIIGDEQRLDWMEGLEKIRQQNLVADFRYNIAPQKNYVAQPPIDSGNFDIHYSEMKLQFDLLHEAQLLDFFEALRTNIKGWYQLEGCTLHRTGSGNEQTATARLKAECSGGWITVKNRNAK